MSRVRVFATLAVVAIASTFAVDAVTGFSSRITLAGELTPDGGSYADRHVERAIRLLDHGTLGDEQEPFLGGFARGPIEAGYIAFAFLLFGRDMWSLWVLNMIIFVAAVWLLYLIGMRLLGEQWAIVPAVLLALFWGAVVYVFNVNNEIISLFFVLGFMYAMLRYHEEAGQWLLALAGIVLGLLVLTKPIFEYFLPIMVLILLWQLWGRSTWRFSATATIIFSAGIFLVVGGWHTRNYVVLGTPRISAGGHSLLIRAQGALYSADTYKGFLIASIAGDGIADAVVPGYAAKNEPRETIREIFNRRRPALRIQGYTEFETDDMFFAEAFDIIRNHPLRYVGSTPAWLMRMNGPPRYNGGVLERLLVDTHPELSRAQKAVINLVIRVPWYIFIGIVWWMIGRVLYNAVRGKENVFLLWMAAFALYTNAAYAFLAHAEVRYLLVAMPFYFLFVVVWFKQYFIHES